MIYYHITNQLFKKNYYMKSIHNLFAYLGIKVLYKKNYQKLMDEFRLNKIDLEIISKYCKDLNSLDEYLRVKDFSKSQLRQDIFALFILNFKKKGFFVEIGAADGIYCSNTYLMEKYLSWDGVLVEPLEIYNENLQRNRNSIIDNSIIWSENNITKKIYYNNEDILKSSVFNPKKNFVEKKTLRFDTLLANHKINHPIDYCSIDIEGAEVELLKGFDFKTHINVISIEHNYNIKNREEIFKILKQNNFKRLGENFSMYDDYYVNNNIK
jgi:FkbM family methyltransferase